MRGTPPSSGHLQRYSVKTGCGIPGLILVLCTPPPAIPSCWRETPPPQEYEIAIKVDGPSHPALPLWKQVSRTPGSWAPPETTLQRSIQSGLKHIRRVNGVLSPPPPPQKGEYRTVAHVWPSFRTRRDILIHCSARLDWITACSHSCPVCVCACVSQGAPFPCQNFLIYQ